MTSLGEQQERFLHYLTEVRGRAYSTAEAYDRDLTQFNEFLITYGLHDYAAVTTSTIEDYLGQLSISSATKARIRSSISSLFSYLYRQDYITADPCQRLESIKLREKEPTFFTLQQYRLLLEAVSHASPYYRLRDKTILSLLFVSGLRRSELVGLNIGDIDIPGCRMKVLRKGGKTMWLPLHPESAKGLKNYLQTRQSKPNEPLFYSRLGNRLSGAQLWHLVKKYAAEAGLPKNLAVHSLRHGNASTLLAQGMPVTYIQRLLGHSNLSTTERYLHYQAGQVEAALGQIRF